MWLMPSTSMRAGSGCGLAACAAMRRRPLTSAGAAVTTPLKPHGSQEAHVIIVGKEPQEPKDTDTTKLFKLPPPDILTDSASV